MAPEVAKREAETLSAPKLHERHRVMVRYLGKKLCTWCLTPCTGRRSTWCSDECVSAYFLVHDWKAVRAAVFKRDAGVCRHCARDTQRAQETHRKIIHHAMRLAFPDRSYYFSRSVYTLRNHPDARVQRWRDLAVELATSFGFGATQYTDREWWEADHIIERVRGGKDALENLRTLCLRCHKIETARLARERADERRSRVPLGVRLVEPSSWPGQDFSQ